MQSNIQWIVFDLGGVVVKLNIDGFLVELARRSGTDRKVIERFQHSRDESGWSPDEKLHRGQLSTDQYINLLNKALRFGLEREEMIALRLKVIQGEDENVLEIIRLLCAGRRVACFSNTHAIHWNHMTANYQSLKLFHRTIASHLIQAAKPDAEAFAIACRELEAEPGECLLIDDALGNVEAARAAGWHAIHFKDVDRLQADLSDFGIFL
jgi:FMN phosphatase YigB (HAD superfamily)